MKREDAFYHKIMLITGLDAGYDEWLNHYLESENPLSDIVLELAYCGSDINKIITILHNYCAEQPIDEADVCDKARLFFKKAYYSEKMSKEEIVFSMYHLTQNVGDSGDFNIQLWYSMYYFEYYYNLANDGILAWDDFDSAFFSYLDNGTPIDSERIWSHDKK